MRIDPELYTKYNVKRGLRDVNGKGVLTGLTEIADVHSYYVENGETIYVPGILYYRGYDLKDIVEGFPKESTFGFEEVAYLLLEGELPTKEELKSFIDVLGSYRTLPPSFTRDVIMKATTQDMMNALARCVIMLYSYDMRADDLSLENVMRQSISLIAKFPMLAIYSYNAYLHYFKDQSLIIHNPDPTKSTAENMLLMMRPDQKYSAAEAKLLDIALVTHAEHGGGNNSTFTTHVVTSTGTDTYSSVVASLGSLKGPRHGGANLKVMDMFRDLKANVSNWSDEGQLTDYLHSLLDKKGFDHSGLIYGMGHAVYAISDPRAQIFKDYIGKVAVEKGYEEEYKLYQDVERIASELITRKRKIFKGVSANVDFYSGFVYQMLGLPIELYTPTFAIARIVGWSAHRIEELANEGKIIRPAYMNVQSNREYIPMDER